jgi:hypothetical protein
LKQNIYKDYSHEGGSNCRKYSNMTNEGILYTYIINNELDATLIEDVKFTKFDHFQLLAPFEGTSYYIEVDPGESQIVLVKKVKVIDAKVLFSYQ